MSSSLVDELKSVLSPSLLGAAAAAVVETPEATERAIAASASEIFRGVTQAVRSPSTLAALFNIFRDGGEEAPRLADLFSVYQGRLSATSLGSLANSLIGLLFGSSTISAIERIAKASGVGTASATSLLGYTAQHMIPLLGGELLRTGDVSVAGLQRLIALRGGTPISDLITEVAPYAPPRAANGDSAGTGAMHTASTTAPAAAAAHTGGSVHHHAPLPKVEAAPVRKPAAAATSSGAPHHAAAYRERDSATPLWLLPVTALVLGGLGWALWKNYAALSPPAATQISEARTEAAAPAAKEEVKTVAAPATAPAPKEDVAETSPPPPAPSAEEPAHSVTVAGSPAQTDYYAATKTFAAEVWFNSDYATEAPVAVAEADTAAAEPAVETLAAAVPGQTDYYEATNTFAAETWVDPDYTFAAAEPADAAEVPAEALAATVPGHTDYYEATNTFAAETWVDPSYTFAAADEPAEPAAAETLATPVPGTTDFYAATAPFTAETWVDQSYTVAAAETEAVADPEPVLPSPVPGTTDFYPPTAPFSAETWIAPVEVAAAEEPVAAPVPGQTDYYGGMTGSFRADVWYPPKEEAVVKCQEAVNKALGPIRFRSAKADLTDEGRAQLDQMAAAIKSCPAARIRVEGHTDSDGDEGFNQQLSESRAKAVIAYLNSVGVDTVRLSPVGYGETQPVASNETSEGKAQNRRIGFVVEGL